MPTPLPAAAAWAEAFAELKAFAPRITAHEGRLGCPYIAAGHGVYARLARLQFETGAAALTAIAEAAR